MPVLGKIAEKRTESIFYQYEPNPWSITTLYCEEKLHIRDSSELNRQNSAFAFLLSWRFVFFLESETLYKSWNASEKELLV